MVSVWAPAAYGIDPGVNSGSLAAPPCARGSARLERSRGDYLTQRGGTGYGVRLIIELATRLSE